MNEFRLATCWAYVMLVVGLFNTMEGVHRLLYEGMIPYELTVGVLTVGAGIALYLWAQVLKDRAEADKTRNPPLR